MIYSFLYVFAFSIALVLIQKIDITIPPEFSLLITASIATVYFNVINIRKLKAVYQECWNNKLIWLSIMMLVLVMWGCTMAGPGMIGASSFNFLYFSWLGMLGFVSLFISNRENNKNKLTFGLLILTLIIINAFLELHHSYTKEIVLGILLALIGGTGSFIYFKQSQVLIKKANLSASQILAARFYLAIIVLIAFIPKGSFITYINLTNIISLLLLALLSLIIPLYFSQKALEKITSEQHAIINSLCPIVTGILQEVIFKDLRIEQMVIYVLYTVVISSYYIINTLISGKMKKS